MPDIDFRKLRLGEILIENNVITEKHLDIALEATKTTGKKLGEVLINLGFITEKQLLQTLSYQMNIPLIELQDYPIKLDKVKLISEDWAKKFEVLILGEEDGHLVMAMTNPLDYNTRDTVRLFTDKEIKVVICTHASLSKAIQDSYRELNVEHALGSMDQASGLIDTEMGDADTIAESSAPIITLLNNILRKAVTSNASDVHFETYEKIARVRMRIDGDLKEEFSLKTSTYTNLVARIKVAANLNTVEKRLPQDGRINMVINRQNIDFRISVLPTYAGEKVVIRILNQTQALLSLEELGFTADTERLYRNLITSPNGIILVTGPTGSGKTTTLYATLSALNSIDKNITTVENPVEYKLFGINQIQTNEALGLDFNVILRSILRQDPDIIMIGEIRDEETAAIAIRAASTGHLVLSTLHTNDSVSTIGRLIDMGIPPYLITDSLRGVIAQRLVKKICPQCKTSVPATPDQAAWLGIKEGTPLYHGTGCSHCENTGYKGRIAIYEMLPIDGAMQRAIEKKANSAELYQLAESKGLVRLADSCKELVLKGITTIQEHGKITYTVRTSSEGSLS